MRQRNVVWLPILAWNSAAIMHIIVWWQLTAPIFLPFIPGCFIPEFETMSILRLVGFGRGCIGWVTTVRRVIVAHAMAASLLNHPQLVMKHCIRPLAWIRLWTGRRRAFWRAVACILEYPVQVCSVCCLQVAIAVVLAASSHRHTVGRLVNGTNAAISRFCTRWC